MATPRAQTILLEAASSSAEIPDTTCREALCASARLTVPGVGQLPHVIPFNCSASLATCPACVPVAVSCHHSAATVFGTTVLMALMHSTAQARSHQLQVKPTARSCHHRHWAQ
ncbi:uncharacterized protein LOC135807184 [Sycon ciliatum]|uniref:uncharacterized protein LOC135807184 n=1 Tax=Sycon ciliatum TaxID=27933 RepID=UPI0031F644A9